MDSLNRDNSVNSLHNNTQKTKMNDFEKILSNYKLKPVNKSTVGFSKIASQVHREVINRGFQLNVMIIGCAGLGKSSFLNNLFQTQFPEYRMNESVTESPTFLLVENEVRLELKIIKAQDFGKNINNNHCWKSIENYLKHCFERQLNEEMSINRSSDRVPSDNLVHACLYFIQPSGEDRCLRELDLEFLKSAHDKVNIIPLIAKADSMTQEEIKIHKFNLLNELNMHGIKYFKFRIIKDSGWRPNTPDLKYPERKYIQRLIDRFPFAVAAGNQAILVDNNQVTVRSYPWGFIQIDDLNHCDTLAVRTLVLSTHLHELITETRTNIYENYRSKIFEKSSFKLAISQQNQYHPLLYMEAYFRKVHSALEKKVGEMERGFQELANKKFEALDKKRDDIERESVEMSKEINYLYSKLEQECSYFIGEKTKWDNENAEEIENYGTLKIKKPNLLSVLSKFGR